MKPKIHINNYVQQRQECIEPWDVLLNDLKHLQRDLVMVFKDKWKTLRKINTDEFT